MKKSDDFPKMLVGVRRAHAMSQADVARKLGVGQQAVSNWERGLSRPETRDLVRGIAALFPEIRAEDWLAAAQRKAPPRPQKPVHPPLHELPFDRLTPARFQSFVAMLLRAKHPHAVVNEFGIEGDEQDGIDIEVRLPARRYEVYQCKRVVKFGPEMVRAAFKRIKRSCRRAVIVLARRATASARSAISRSQTRRVLWDANDLVQEIRRLPLPRQKSILRTYFGAHFNDFLGVETADALESPEDFFGALLDREKIFSHAWTLVGRDAELRRLLEFTERAAPTAALLVGPGGIGKSRLALEVSRSYAARHPDCLVHFLAPSQDLTATDVESIADEAGLVVIEDAHARTDLEATVHRILNANRSTHLLITTRPYAMASIRAELSRCGLECRDADEVQLTSLSIEDAERVAREILRENGGRLDLASAIVCVTEGSTLALVLGSHLVASDRIHPGTLNNSKSFRDRIFQAFRDAIAGEVGPSTERETIAQTLNLVALLQPVDPSAPAFDRIIEVATKLDAPAVRRAVETLHHAGVLVRHGRFFSIVPDLIADFVVERTCLLSSSNGSTGYAERVMSACDDRYLANVLLNVSKLDWRLGESRRSNLADVAWERVQDEYKKNSLVRGLIAEAVSQAAAYQPERAIRFVDDFIGTERAHETFSKILKHAALTADDLEGVAARLWRLGLGDRRPLNQHPYHPVRILNELAAIHPGSLVERCERIVRFGMRLIRDGERGVGGHSAFGMLRAAFHTEGHTTDFRDGKFVMSPFGIRRDAVAAMREEVVDFLLERVASRDFVVAMDAAGALQDALRYPIGMVNRQVETNERNAWTPEFVATLRKIQRHIERGDLDPFVKVRLLESISWHANYADGDTRSEAIAVHDAVDRTLLLRLSLALWDTWGQVSLNASADDRREKWEEERTRVASDLVREVSDPNKALDVLRERIGRLAAAGHQTTSTWTFLAILSNDRPDLAALACSVAVERADDPLRPYFGAALLRLATCRPDEAHRLASSALGTEDTVLLRGVAEAFSALLCGGGEISPAARALVERVVQCSDCLAVQAILRGIASRPAAETPWVLRTLVSAPIDRSARVADEVCSQILHAKTLGFDALDDLTIRQILEKLRACPSIHDYWVEHFIGAASVRLPQEVLDLLFKRIIDRYGAGASTEEPFSFQWDRQTPLRYRELPDFPRHLRSARNWMLYHRENDAVRFWGPMLYSAVAGGYDAALLDDLREWGTHGDRQQMDVVAAILTKAPSSFVFTNRPFVVELLEHAVTLGKECLDEVRSSIEWSVRGAARQGSFGSPFPEDVEQKTNSEAAIAMVSRSSPAWKFFDDLRRDAESNIRRKQQRDEEVGR